MKSLFIIIVFIPVFLFGQNNYSKNDIDRIISKTDQDWENNLKSSLDSLEWALQISNSNNWKLEEVKVLSELTQFMLRKLNNYERATYYVGEIKKVISRFPDDAEINSIYHNTLGILYFHEGVDRKRALNEFKKSIDVATKNNIEPGYSSTNNYALVLIQEEKYDDAIRMLNKAQQQIYKNYKPNDRSIFLSLNFLNKGICYIHKEMPDSVIFCFQKSLENAFLSNKDEDIFRAYLYLGVYNQEIGNYQEAIGFLDKAKEFIYIPLNYSAKILLYESLADCYQNINKFEQANYNRSLQVLYIDSLKQQGYLKQAFTLDYKFELDSIRNQKKVSNLRRIAEKRQLQSRLTIGVSVFIIVIILAFFIIYRLYKQKQISFIKLKNEELEREKIKQQAQLEIFRKEEELIQANVELSINKNELQGLKLKLQNHLDKSHDPEFDDLKYFLKQINNSEKKSEQLKYLDHVLNFSTNSFYKRLKEKHSNLSEDQMRLTTLIRLNLTSEELMVIFNVSGPSLMTKRYRLRKKFGIKHDESLEEYIINI